jgi:hypothetical protein
MLKPMSQKIPQEILQDLCERSKTCAIPPHECVVWRPLVCEYALDLAKEKTARDRAIKLISKIEDRKKLKSARLKSLENKAKTA